MNNVYLPGSSIPLNPFELASEANAITKRKPFSRFDFFGPDSRIRGNHCNCMGDGEFELLSKEHPDVTEGGKRYMQCRICGCWSHL